MLKVWRPFTTAEGTEGCMEAVVMMQTELGVYVPGRLPVPGIASPNQHCRCKRAVCPRSRRRTAAGPCCRRSCSCRSPRLLGVQGNPGQPLCQGPNVQSVTDPQRHRGLHQSLVALGEAKYLHRFSKYVVTLSPEWRTQREKKSMLFPSYSSTWWQDHGCSSQRWVKSPPPWFIINQMVRQVCRALVLFFTFQIIFIHICNQ